MHDFFCGAKMKGGECVLGKKHAGPHVTHDQLREAFKLVQNKTNWKLPINAVLKPVPSIEKIRLIEEAVVFFAGCRAEVTIKNGAAHVSAVGYYVAVGA